MKNKSVVVQRRDGNVFEGFLYSVGPVVCLDARKYLTDRRESHCVLIDIHIG